MESWKPVFDENHQIMLNGNNIVLQHINTQEIGYIEDNTENRIMLSLPINEEASFTEKNDSCISEDELDHQTDSNKVSWSHKLTKLLIVKRLGKEQVFNRPKSKKIKLWNEIAKEMNKDTKEAFSLTGPMCDNKFRNLLKTYKINKKKQKSSGESAITWEYFDDFDVVLGCKASIEPPDNMLFDSLDNDLNNTNEDDNSSQTKNLVNVNSQPVPSTSKTENYSKKNKTMKFQEYLYLKNKREEEKENRRATFSNKKWEEERELRRSETDAILKLAEALTKSASNN